MSFWALVDQLSNLSKTERIPKIGQARHPCIGSYRIGEPTKRQKQAFDLLGVKIK